MGNSAFILLVSTLIPIYFNGLAEQVGVNSSDSVAYWGYAVSVSTLIVALTGPVLGAVSDKKGRKKTVVFGVRFNWRCGMLVSWII